MYSFRVMNAEQMKYQVNGGQVGPGLAFNLSLLIMHADDGLLRTTNNWE